MKHPILLLTLTTLLAMQIAAQEDAAKKKPQGPLERLTKLLGRIQELGFKDRAGIASDDELQTLATKRKELEEFIDSARASDTTLTKQEIRPIVVLLCEFTEDAALDGALEIARAAVARFPNDDDMHLSLGRAAFARGQETYKQPDRTNLLAEAEQALRKSIEKGGGVTAKYSLYELMKFLARYDEQLTLLETVMRDKSFSELLDKPNLERGRLLLLLGRHEEAAKALTDPAAQADSAEFSRLFCLRAHALAGDFASAQKVAAEMVAEHKGSARAIGAQADLLLAQGKTKEALAALQQPVLGLASDGDAERIARKQSLEALKMLVNRRPNDLAQLRVSLLKSLGIRLTGKEGKGVRAKPVDLTNSPTVAAYTCLSRPVSPQKWVEQIVLALSIKTVGKNKPSPVEMDAALALTYGKPRPLDPILLQDTLRTLRAGIADADCAAPLLCLRLADELAK